MHFSPTLHRLGLYLLFAAAYAFVLIVLTLGRESWTSPGEPPPLAADHGLLDLHPGAASRP